MSARSISLPSFIAAGRMERRVETSLVSGGRFDTRAIMVEAVKLARSISRLFGSWQVRMSIALRTVWKRAKAAMTETCAAEPFPIREPTTPKPIEKPRRAGFARSTTFVRGSRATSHGW